MTKLTLEEKQELIRMALAAREKAYAPYSGFMVGAALRAEDGRIFTGCNVELHTTLSSICAERTACFQASALHPGVPMRKIAIAAWTRLHQPENASFDDCFQLRPISPCGSCRQALLEYENMYGPIEVLLYGREGVVVLPSVASLLPLCFTEF